MTQILTVHEAATLLKVTPWFVYKRIRDGKLAHFKLGSDIRLDQAEVLTCFKVDMKLPR